MRHILRCENPLFYRGIHLPLFFQLLSLKARSRNCWKKIAVKNPFSNWERPFVSIPSISLTISCISFFSLRMKCATVSVDLRGMWLAIASWSRDPYMLIPVKSLAFSDPHQGWSLTQFYSVDFSQSRIGVKKCMTHNEGLRQLLLTVSWDLCA